MECYDTELCPGDCNGCRYYVEPVPFDEVRRRRVVRATAVVMVICAVFVWCATRCPGVIP